jgi:hypothetical protein
MQCRLGVSRSFPTSSPTSSWYTGKTFIINRARENRFLGFLYRGAQHIIVAMPMNLIFVYIVIRFFRSKQTWNLATFGIFGIGEGKERPAARDLSIYENPALIPFAWNFFINMLLIILYANIDVS